MTSSNIPTDVRGKWNSGGNNRHHDSRVATRCWSFHERASSNRICLYFADTQCQEGDRRSTRARQINFHHERYFNARSAESVHSTKDRNLASSYVRDGRTRAGVRKYNKTFSINNVRLSALAVSNITSFPVGFIALGAHCSYMCKRI